MDGQTWITLDEVTADSNLLSEPDQIATRQITIANIGEYQFFRLQQIGPNSKDGNRFVLQAWEIYGTLIKPL
jgi:hypothetical protein